MSVARDGDLMSCGGVIKSSAMRTFVNGLLIIRLGDIFICNGVEGKITGSALLTFAEGLPVARVGDSGFCPIHGNVTVDTGSPDTFAN